MTQKSKRCRLLVWAEHALATLLAALSALVLYQVLSRYVPSVPPLLWTEEIARGLLIWLVMVGAGLGVADGTHFRMSVLGTKMQSVIAPLVGYLIIIAGSYLTYSALTLSERGIGRTSLVTGLPAVWVYSAIVAGGALTVLGAIAALLSNRTSPDEPLGGGVA